MKTNIKAKNGKSFPDLNKDGKVTRADILKGRGVIAKNGKPIKKANFGALIPLVMKALPMVAGLLGGKKKKMGGTIKKNPKMKIGGMLGGLLGKNGKTIKKAQNGTVQSANQQTQSNVNKIAMKNAGDSMKKSMAGNAKNGKSMKKCRYGCK